MYKLHLVGYIKYMSSDARFHECKKKKAYWMYNSSDNKTMTYETQVVHMN